MKGNVRAAAIGGLTAMIVMALAFAPRLLGAGHPAEVRFRDTVADAAPMPTESSSSTIEAPTTSLTSAASTTTTARAGAVTATTLKATTTTSVVPTTAPPTSLLGPSSTTTAVTAPAPQCGVGSISASASLARVASGYQLVVRFDNRSDRTIEIDGTVLSATYPTGSVRYDAPVKGQRIEPRAPGTEPPGFPVPDSVTDDAPTQFEIWEFRWHVADHPECASA